MAKFDWVPFYSELADKLPPFRQRQSELIAFLEELRAQGLTITPMEDKDETGKRFRLTEIDPFTFLGAFNRGTVKETRVRIAEAMAKRFGVKAPVPTDFSGIPVLNNQKSWFFSYSSKRKAGDIDRLWNVFEAALPPDALASASFSKAFDEALAVRNTNINLTIGLFWIRAKTFLSLDSTMRDFLGIKLPPGGLSFAFYRPVVEDIKTKRGAEFPALSHAAYLAGDDSGVKETPRVGTAQSADVDYWFVGAYWDNQEPKDQTERFLAEGVWENGFQDKLLEEVKSMKVGDKIAIKAATTQSEDLPFDNRGKTVSRMVIKATGTIVSNPKDGHMVEVEWDSSSPTSRNWYFYTGRATIWKLRKNDEFAQRLIRFTFLGEPQDYDFFIKTWWDEEPGEGAHARISQPEGEPYGIANMLAEGVFLSKAEIEIAIERLESKRNLILQGAPGVGKTFVAKRLAYAFMEARDESRVEVVQFHPSYAYEDFVRGYRPSESSGQFELIDGPFLELCTKAADDLDRQYVLIIEEINRANLSQVLGEMFTLLEADKRGSDHKITPLYRRSISERISVPENLHVIGTMNIADRSLAMVDYALRRRFAFLTLEPRFGDEIFRQWLDERGMPSQLISRIVTRMTALNQAIADDGQLGPAFRIGHSFFCPAGKDFSKHDVSWFNVVVRTDIAPLLREYWFDDRQKADNAIDALLAG